MVEAVVAYVYSLDGTRGATHSAIWMGLLGHGTDAAAREAIGTERREHKNVEIVSMEFSRVAVAHSPQH